MNSKFYKISLNNKYFENNSNFSTYHLPLPNTAPHTERERDREKERESRSCTMEKGVDKILKSLLMAQGRGLMVVKLEAARTNKSHGFIFSGPEEHEKNASGRLIQN